MKNFIAFIICVTVIFFVGCDNSDPEPAKSVTDSMLKVSEGYAVGAAVKIEMYVKSPFKVGYNNVYFKLTDSTSGGVIDDSHIHLYPEMDMGTMKHGAPVVEVDHKAVDGLFSGAVVFSMPSGDMGKWNLIIEVHNHKNDKESSTSFEVNVSNAGSNLFKTITTLDDSTKLYLAIAEPQNPKVGINELTMSLHYQKDAFSFPKANGYTLQFEPTMPSMGHGSPNNVQPIDGLKGLHSGRVNFSMTGDWRMDVKVLKGTDEVAKTYFELNVSN